jgi:hypothetical protein
MSKLFSLSMVLLLLAFLALRLSIQTTRVPSVLGNWPAAEALMENACLLVRFTPRTRHIPVAQSL